MLANLKNNSDINTMIRWQYWPNAMYEHHSSLANYAIKSIMYIYVTNFGFPFNIKTNMTLCIQLVGKTLCF